MSFKDTLGEHRASYWVIALLGFTAAVALIFFQNEAFYRDFIGYFSGQSQLDIRKFRHASLTIDFGDGRKRAFRGETESGMTILSALRRSSEVGGFKNAVNKGGVITAVGDVVNSGNKQWRAYRNGMPVAGLPGHEEIWPGDKIILRYE